jgi:hypothetical protein
MKLRKMSELHSRIAILEYLLEEERKKRIAAELKIETENKKRNISEDVILFIRYMALKKDKKLFFWKIKDESLLFVHSNTIEDAQKVVIEKFKNSELDNLVKKNNFGYVYHYPVLILSF